MSSSTDQENEQSSRLPMADGEREKKDRHNAWRREYRRKNIEKTRERGRADSKLWRERHPEQHAAKRDGWNAANPERVKSYMKDYAKKNHETLSEYQREYQRDWGARNKEKKKFYAKRWEAERPGIRSVYGAERRARELQATPPWLTKEQKRQIRLIYAQCYRLTQQTGIQHHVDHIHPLRGKRSWGLHVPWNLQVLTATENMRKHNHNPD